ncbi:hypothetical protein BVY01_00955, partial [bacterium I07]
MINRRRFMKEMAGLGLESYLVMQTLGCSKSPTETETDDTIPVLKNVNVSLKAPVEVRLAEGNTLSVMLDGSGSSGGIETYLWEKKGPGAQNYSSVGDKNILNDTIDTPGENQYRLTAANSYTSKSASHSILALAHEAPYNVPIAAFDYAYGGALVLIDPVTFKETVFFQGIFDGLSASWESNGNRIAFTQVEPGRRGDIYTIDVSTKVVEKILLSQGYASRPSWRPTGDWVMCMDDGRFANQESDELVLVNPDTKEVVYLSG